MADQPGQYSGQVTRYAYADGGTAGASQSYLMSGYNALTGDQLLWISEGTPDYAATGSGVVPTTAVRNVYVVLPPASPAE